MTAEVMRAQRPTYRGKPWYWRCHLCGRDSALAYATRERALTAAGHHNAGHHHRSSL